MTSRDRKDPRVTQNLQPSRRDRFLPVELLAISGGLAVFVGLIVLVATREFILAAVGLGVTFIVAVVLLARPSAWWRTVAHSPGTPVSRLHLRDALHPLRPPSLTVLCISRT